MEKLLRVRHKNAKTIHIILFSIRTDCLKILGRFNILSMPNFGRRLKDLTGKCGLREKLVQSKSLSFCLPHFHGRTTVFRVVSTNFIVFKIKNYAIFINLQLGSCKIEGVCVFFVNTKIDGTTILYFEAKRWMYELLHH